MTPLAIITNLIADELEKSQDKPITFILGFQDGIKATIRACADPDNLEQWIQSAKEASAVAMLTPGLTPHQMNRARGLNEFYATCSFALEPKPFDVKEACQKFISVMNSHRDTPHHEVGIVYCDHEFKEIFAPVLQNRENKV
jgi:hypothetical protein